MSGLERISDVRRDFVDRELRQGDIGDDPMAFVQSWLASAADSERGDAEHNAMALATAGADGAPSVRMVLCRGIDPERAAVRWYTGTDGRKGAELSSNPRAAITFYWATASRQVRVTGRVERAPAAEVAHYFAGRPAASRASAHTSRQSHPIAARIVLDDRGSAADDPRLQQPPDHWGGYDLIADEIEFWQGRPGRNHDRVLVLRAGAAVVDRFDLAELSAASTELVDPYGVTWLRTRLQP